MKGFALVLVLAVVSRAAPAEKKAVVDEVASNDRDTRSPAVLPSTTTRQNVLLGTHQPNAISQAQIQHAAQFSTNQLGHNAAGNSGRQTNQGKHDYDSKNQQGQSQGVFRTPNQQNNQGFGGQQQNQQLFNTQNQNNQQQGFNQQGFQQNQQQGVNQQGSQFFGVSGFGNNQQFQNLGFGGNNRFQGQFSGQSGFFNNQNQQGPTGFGNNQGFQGQFSGPSGSSFGTNQGPQGQFGGPSGFAQNQNQQRQFFGPTGFTNNQNQQGQFNAQQGFGNNQNQQGQFNAQLGFGNNQNRLAQFNRFLQPNQFINQNQQPIVGLFSNNPSARSCVNSNEPNCGASQATHLGIFYPISQQQSQG